jgi:hypothetical protein
MGWALAHTGERSIQRFWWRDLRERNHMEDLDLEKRITLKQMYMKWINGACCIDLFQDGDIWRFFCELENEFLSRINLGQYLESNL